MMDKEEIEKRLDIMRKHDEEHTLCGHCAQYIHKIWNGNTQTWGDPIKCPKCGQCVRC